MYAVGEYRGRIFLLRCNLNGISLHTLICIVYVTACELFSLS